MILARLLIRNIIKAHVTNKSSPQALMKPENRNNALVWHNYRN